MKHKLRKSKRKQRHKKKLKTRKIFGGTIRTSSADEFDLQLVNIINGKQIYRITIEDCHYYLYRNNMNYLLFKKDNIYHIIKFEDSISDILESDISDIKNVLKNTQHEIELYSRLQSMHIKYFIKKINCHREIDLTEAKETIKILNTRLHEKEYCKDLKIELNYLYNIDPPNKKLTAYTLLPESLILCLNNREGCISSIIIEVDRNKLGISSKTSAIFEGNSYNKLLRCVVIIISKLLYPDIDNLQSLALNPVSAYLLINYFNGIIDETNKRFFEFLKDKQDFLKDKHIEINDNPDYKELFRYFTDFENGNFELIVSIPLTPPNIENAENKFSEILQMINCRPTINPNP